MSYYSTKQALITQLLTVANASDIAFENKRYDPSGKEFWYAAYFRPATTETTGKTLDSSDQQYGFFQVTIFTKRNISQSDNLSLEKSDLILSAFKNTTSISYNGQIVDILDSTINEGSTEESWYQRNITINYLTFSER